MKVGSILVLDAVSAACVGFGSSPWMGTAVLFGLVAVQLSFAQTMAHYFGK